MMPQQCQHSERSCSSSESALSVSSASSSDDEDETFRSKYMNEKEKSKKLQEALAVAVGVLQSHLPSGSTCSSKETRIACPGAVAQQGSEEVFTDLEYARESLHGSKKNTSSSASFVVLDRSKDSGSSASFVHVVRENADELEQPHLVEDTSPVSENFLTAVGFEEVFGSDIGSAPEPTSGNSLNKQSLEEKAPQSIPSNQQTEVKGGSHKGSSQPTSLQLSDQQGSHSHSVSLQGKSIGSQKTQSLPAQEGGIHSKSVECPSSQKSDNPPQLMETGLLVLPNASTPTNMSRSVQSLGEMPSGAAQDKVPTISARSSGSSVHSSSQGVPSVTAWLGSTVQPTGQRQPELLSNALGMNNLGSISKNKCAEQTETFDQGTTQSRLPTESLLPSPINDLSRPDTQTSTTTAGLVNRMCSEVPPSAPTWGVGARPKANNTLREGSQPLPIIPHIPLTPSVAPTHTSEHAQRQSDQDKDRLFDPFSGYCTQPSPQHPPTSTAGTSDQHFSHMIPASSEHLWSFGDLMGFPSLKTSPSPEEKQREPSPQTVQGRVAEQQRVAVPSENESELLSQAHSMMAALEDSNPAGISDMLYKFAQSASQMESKLLQYQALIQRQQVQIQSLSQHSATQELEQLRKENSNLLAYINKSRKKHPESIMGSSSPTIEKCPVEGGESHTSENLEKRVQVLENLNAKLFQANKEWSVRWEMFQQHRKDDRKDFETRLQMYETEKEKFHNDYLTLEQQLTEAVAARQEANKTKLELEQDKLNLSKKVETLKAETENLARHKRQLETELLTLKTDKLKMKRPADMGQCKEELEGEIALLKQQLTVFHDDFKKEREDRQKAETTAERMRRQQETMKAEHIAKTKKWQTMMKTKDEAIKQKNRKLADLQYQVDHLKIQLQRERKLLALQNQGSITPGTPAPGGQPSTMARNFTFNTTDLLNGAETRPAPNRSPEHQPGAWECRMCTFINFPEKRNCEICNWAYEPAEAKGTDLLTGRLELHSRGDLCSIETDTSDLPTHIKLEVDGPTK